MAEPLTPEQEAAVRDLWKSPCSTREAERKTGVCKSMVARIWDKQATERLEGTEGCRLPKYEKPVFRVVKPRKMCPDCERLVSLWPCVACTARKFKEEKDNAK